MKPFYLGLFVAMAGCSTATMPSPAATLALAPVAVMSEATGMTQSVTLAATDPQPPSCAWRDMVIAKHIALGGRTNDTVTLANLHRVFIQDVLGGYVLEDYPAPWCLP